MNKSLIQLQESIASLSADFAKAIDQTLNDQTKLATSIKKNAKDKMDHFDKVRQEQKDAILSLMAEELQTIQKSTDEAIAFTRDKAEQEMALVDSLFDTLVDAELESMGLVDKFQNQVAQNGSKFSRPQPVAIPASITQALADNNVDEFDNGNEVEDDEEVEVDSQGKIISRDDVDGDGKPD